MLRKSLVFLLIYFTCSLCYSATEASIPCGFPGKPMYGKVYPESDFYTTNKTVNYECHTGAYLYHNKSKVRTCINGSWTGTVPICAPNIALGKGVEVWAGNHTYNNESLERRKVVDNDNSTCLHIQPKSDKRRLSLGLGAFYSVQLVVLYFQSDQNVKVLIINSVNENKTFCHLEDKRNGKDVRNTSPWRFFNCKDTTQNGDLSSGILYDTISVEDDSADNTVLVLCELYVYIKAGREAVCGVPEAPAFGSAYYNNNSMDTVQYKCQQGYTLIGNNTRKCDPNGSKTYWHSGKVPICVKTFHQSDSWMIIIIGFSAVIGIQVCMFIVQGYACFIDWKKSNKTRDSIIVCLEDTETQSLSASIDSSNSRFTSENVEHVYAKLANHRKPRRN